MNKVINKAAQKKPTASKTANFKAPPKKTTQKKVPQKKTTTQKPTNPTNPTSKPKTASSDKHTRTGPVITYHVCDNLTKKFRVAENARAATFKGFEGFQFFLHKSITDKGWTISEASSGASIVTKPTQASVTSRAKEILAQYGNAGLLDCVQKAIDKNGTAPGFKAPEHKPSANSTQTFDLTTKDGTKVNVTYQPGNQHHLEFRGKISSTGYKSHFGFNGKGDVKEYATKYAEELRNCFLKEQVKQTRTNNILVVKPAPGTSTKDKPAVESSGKGGKPKGKLSMLDAAAEILKTAKEPLCCKDICRAIFEKKLAESSGRTPHATISAAMGREIKTLGKDSRFRRVDRGLFELNK